VSIISHWQLHCLLEIQCSRTIPTRHGWTRLLWASAKWQWLPEQFDAESQVSCYRGQATAHASVWRTNNARVDLSSMHEEADIFLTTSHPSILPKKIQNQQSVWFLTTLTCLLCCSTSTGVRSFNQQWLCTMQSPIGLLLHWHKGNFSHTFWYCTLSPSNPCPYWLRLSCSIIWNWQDKSNWSVKTRPRTWSTWSVDGRSHRRGLKQ